jgi:hypothetical protein
MVTLSASTRRHSNTVTLSVSAAVCLGPARWRHCRPSLGVAMAMLSDSARRRARRQPGAVLATLSASALRRLCRLRPGVMARLSASARRRDWLRARAAVRPEPALRLVTMSIWTGWASFAGVCPNRPPAAAARCERVLTATSVT